MIARGILDNRVADKARNDDDVLAELIRGIRDADATLPLGYTETEQLHLFERGAEDGLEEEELADDPADSSCALGDAWQCGAHVVVCGDCCDASVVEHAFRVAGAAAADQLLTDPPYGVGYGAAAADQLLTDPPYGVGYTGRGTRVAIANDTGRDYANFFQDFLKLAPLAQRNTAYVFMSGQELHNLRAALDVAGFTWGDYLVWVKQHFVLGRKDYNAGHEFVVYAWKGTHRFWGQKGKATTVLTFDRPRSSADHPTMKPVDLLARLIRDGSGPGAVVYDPFLGSGSTMLAAEITGRRCVGIELEPAYCARAVRRWERLTGLTAEKIQTEVSA